MRLCALSLLAAGAAVVEVAAAPADHHSVGSALLAFLCNVGLIAVTFALLHPRHTRDQSPADARLPTMSADDWAPILGGDATVITPLADHVFGLVELQSDTDFGDSAFVQMDDLRWLLGSYVIKGGRLQRLVRLPEFVAAFADRSDNAALGCRAAELLVAIRDTNAAVAEWLLAHRVALPDPDVLDSNALLDRYRRLRIDAAVVSSDPLYLLTCHIHDTLEAAEALNNFDHQVVETLRAQLTRPLEVIDHELRASAAFNAAVGSWLGGARSIEAA